MTKKIRVSVPLPEPLYNQNKMINKDEGEYVDYEELEK